MERRRRLRARLQRSRLSRALASGRRGAKRLLQPAAHGACRRIKSRRRNVCDMYGWRIDGTRDAVGRMMQWQLGRGAQPAAPLDRSLGRFVAAARRLHAPGPPGPRQAWPGGSATRCVRKEWGACLRSGAAVAQLSAGQDVGESSAAFEAMPKGKSTTRAARSTTRRARMAHHGACAHQSGRARRRRQFCTYAAEPQSAAPFPQFQKVGKSTFRPCASVAGRALPW